LLPFLHPFKKGAPKTDTPSRAIFLTVAFILLVCTAPSVDIIASMVTLTALLTYSVLNLACTVLKVSAAPNFRPTFKYFRWWTAAAGMVVAICTMIFVSPTLALSSFGVATALFIVIHYTSPPKSWGNITQSLIYHQVRKYLLRLDTRKEHVKFWRPQVNRVHFGDPSIDQYRRLSY
jgi:solute carrier family 12 (potassium/chloride transporters), member 9